MNQKDNKQTAIERYEELGAEVQKKLKFLSEVALPEENAKALENPSNWGYVGNISYVDDKLDEIIEFISSPIAFAHWEEREEMP
jgi:hypothetical protein